MPEVKQKGKRRSEYQRQGLCIYYRVLGFDLFFVDMGEQNVIEAEKAKLRLRLWEYLQKNGIQFDSKKKAPKLRCLNPGHVDNHPSAILFSETIFCPVCQTTSDIFDVAGILRNAKNFKEKAEIVKQSLLISDGKNYSKPPPKKSPAPKKPPVTFNLEKSKNIYSRDAIEKIAMKKDWGEIAGAWTYRIANGDVIGIDVRFENGDKKTVINFWHDGKQVCHWNSPAMVFGLHEAEQFLDKPILITEGCKCAATASILNAFVSVTWNKGSGNVENIDWSIFKDRLCFMFPDDDEPGIKAAFAIKAKLPQLKIVSPLEAARKIKAKGADIVEALQVLSPEELTKYIIESPELLPPESEPEPESILDFEEKKTNSEINENLTILGIADDGHGYFLNRAERLFSTPLETLTPGKLQAIAPLNFWMNCFATKGKVNWNEAIDFVIEGSTQKEFDVENVRGRGAWKEPNGDICYHDGHETIGKKNLDRIYLTKTKRNIGLNSSPMDLATCAEIVEIVKSMSFEQELDAIRCLAWSCLSPFAGALPWRPAVLLTGPSGSGKTTVIDHVVKKISKASIFSGAETTSAGLRQYIHTDSTAIILEEAECDTPKKKQNRDDLFSLMRQSTSDDAPNIVKGSKDGRAVSFKMCNMFLFAAISPEVESVADDNRIFRVNMIKPKNEWKHIKKKLQEILTDKNCDALRALIWQKLPDILRRVETISDIVQEVTNKDTRSSLAEGLIFSAYYTIFDSNKKDNEIKAEIQKHLGNENSMTRNETEELLDRLLDESVFLPDSKTTKTLRMILQETKDGQGGMHMTEHKDTAARYGLSVDLYGNLNIAMNHHEIMRIIQKGKGYQRFFWRHPNLIEKSASVRIAGKTRRCVVMQGLFNEVEDEEYVEKKGGVVVQGLFAQEQKESVYEEIGF